MVGAFLAEAGTYGCTLLLDDSSLIRNGFGGADIADELFYCKGLSVCHLEPRELASVQELMLNDCHQQLSVKSIRVGGVSKFS